MNRRPKFIITAPRYDQNSGGAIALHNLCHYLNELTESYVLPMPSGTIVNYLNIEKFELIAAYERHFAETFVTSPELNTPVFEGELDEDFVVVYPEVVLGNPIGLKNVARWVLYHSGHHRDVVAIGKGEVNFKWNPGYESVTINGFNEESDIGLMVHVPPQDAQAALERNVNLSFEEMHENRRYTSFIVRKGIKLETSLLNENSIQLDDRDRSEVISIIQDSTHVVSFDPYTFYSDIAAAFGCHSVVLASPSRILDDKLWGERKTQNPWLAFQEEDIATAWQSRTKLLEQFQSDIGNARKNVKAFYQFWNHRLNSA